MATLLPAINAPTEDEFRAQAALVRGWGAPLVQIDVADGILGKPRNAATPALVGDTRGGLRLDLHLMVADARSAVAEWAALAPARVTIHGEASGVTPALFAAVKELGIARGLALAPGTPLESVEPFLAGIDHLLFVGVPPGRSGQTMDPATPARVRAARARAATLDIGVDGGVTAENLLKIVAAGATTIVVSSALFRSGDPTAAYRILCDLASGPGA